MRDARGVVFNVRRELEEIGGTPVLSIIGSDGQPRSSGIRNFDELVKVLAEAEISFRPQLKLFRTGPEMLYDPKSKIWPVRDQGTSRGTCVPFAALAALELDVLRSQDPPTGVDYAEEFVYARSRKELGHLGPGKEPGNDTSGATFLVQAARALIDFGVPPEERLPYKYIQNDPAWTAPVSQSVSDEALLNRLDKSRVFVTLKIHRRPEIENELTEPFFEKESLVVEFIQASLLSGAAVSITLPVYPTGNHSPWTVGNAWKTGVIPDLTDAVKEAGSNKIGHAVCIIGMVPDPGAAEGEIKGWFIFRNSWGTRFGYARPQNPVLDKVLAPGYGAISFSHVAEGCWGMMALLPSG
ncbi:C1 family peptidase [Hoeflea sp. AS60]|uniref:C1 family peptidase n=1 Tax=Hoeflea sp. AS60 TaxID=3135780 RepID=UPI0031720E6B